MAEYIKLAVGAVRTALEARTPGLLEARGQAAFAAFGSANEFRMPAPPACWVVPLEALLAGETTVVELARLTVRIGVMSATDPETLTSAAMEYAAAVTDAIRAAELACEWGPAIKGVAVVQHDYGKLLRGADGFAVFPEVGVVVEFEEEW